MGRKTTIDYVTIASTSNASDFGDLRTQTHMGAANVGASNSNTYGLYLGGYKGTSGGQTTDMEYVTMASTGNTQFWGSLTVAGWQCGGISNPTRGIRHGAIYATWQGGQYVDNNKIGYWSFASTGNASDFGNLVENMNSMSSTSVVDGSRGVMGGGLKDNYDYVEYMQYVTIDSTGNATDFGDMVIYGQQNTWGNMWGPDGNYWPSGVSNGTRGEFWGGVVPDDAYPSRVSIDAVQYITIQSAGNATDAGNLQDEIHAMACGSGD